MNFVFCLVFKIRISECNKNLYQEIIKNLIIKNRILTIIVLIKYKRLL